MVLKMENKKHIALRAFSKNKTTASLQLRKLRGFLVTELNFLIFMDSLQVAAATSWFVRGLLCNTLSLQGCLPPGNVVIKNLGTLCQIAVFWLLSYIKTRLSSTYVVQQLNHCPADCTSILKQEFVNFRSLRFWLDSECL